MYFTRYIWIFIRSIYFKKIKKKFKIKKISKFPLTTIPYLFRKSYKKILYKIKKKKCKKNKKYFF